MYPMETRGDSLEKSDLQDLYRQVKGKRQAKPARTLFDSLRKSKGCKTCGKVTWRPNH